MIEAGVDMDNPIAARAVHDQAFFQPAFEAYRDNFKKLYDTGVTVLAGSDMVLYKAPPLPIHQELGYMVDYGITPVEAVRTATYNAASVLGIEKETGSLKEGLAGDLLVGRKNGVYGVKDMKKLSFSEVQEFLFPEMGKPKRK